MLKIRIKIKTEHEMPDVFYSQKTLLTQPYEIRSLKIPGQCGFNLALTFTYKSQDICSGQVRVLRLYHLE